MNEVSTRILIGCAAAAGLSAVSVWNYRRFMPKPEPLGEKRYRVTVQKVPVRASGHTLYGELLLPKRKQGPLPTVICCHGFCSTYRLCKGAMGMSLAMSGYAVYCFDFYGGSKHSRSGGSLLEMSIFTEREDLRHVIRAVRSFPSTDPNRLFLLGESQGGCVAGITAPEFQDELRGLILYYPAFCIPEDARKKFQRVEDIPEVSKTFGQNVGKVYNEKLLDYDVYDEIRKYDRPVLIMHGDKDRLVPIAYGKKAAEVYPHARFETFHGEIHGFTGAGKKRAIRMTYAFLEELQHEKQ